MRQLSIDIETFSEVDLKKEGVHKYVEHPSFEILMLSYAFDDDSVTTIDLYANYNWPTEHAEFYWALEDPKVMKTAYNANFEILCLSKAFELNLDYSQWTCSMVLAAILGLPTGLFATGIALGLDSQKDLAGKELIKYFCSPCKPTKTNGMRTRNLPEHDRDKWNHFLEYNAGDVVQEMKVKQALSWYKISETEKRIWSLDAKINNLGVEVDPVLVRGALKIAAEYEKECMQQAVELTGLDNPKSVAQIKGWLENAIGEDIESLNKKSMPDVLAQVGNNEIASEVLRLRGELSKTSVKKFDAMLRCTCSDGRARGLLQYYGAARTGRWAGRLIQVQNLKRNSMKQLDLARELVKSGDLESIELLWQSPPDVLSQLVRTGFVAPKGKVFISSDFSAIEARITAWLAQEKWRLDVFNTHGKIYEASAAMMFNKKIDEIGKNSPERFAGKCAELALGFGGGPPALINIGALQMSFVQEAMTKGRDYWDRTAKNEKGWLVIPRERKNLVFESKQEYIDFCVERELSKIVTLWRNVNKKIFQYWYNTAGKVIEAIENPGIRVPDNFGMSYIVHHGRLWITLPSGRELCYIKPVLIPDPAREGKVIIQYQGVDQFTKKFMTQRTYGGKLVENIVQATARDVLAYAMLDLDKAGYKIVMHVHDEVILEVDEATAASDVLRINKIMAQGFSWTKGLPLGAESSVFKYYKKD